METFQQMIDAVKEAREYAQTHGFIPLLPPQLVCYSGDDIKCAVLCPKSDPTQVAAMLATIALVHPEWAFLAMEAFVRPVESDHEGPIGDDPNAQPAMVGIQVGKDGSFETSINPYLIGDDGQLVWSAPGAVDCPAIEAYKIVMSELMHLHLDGEPGQELLAYLQINGYAVRIDPAYQMGSDDAGGDSGQSLH